MDKTRRLSFDVFLPPVCGLTNMLPGGIPFSMMYEELASSTMAGEDGRGQVGGSLKSEMDAGRQQGRYRRGK